MPRWPDPFHPDRPARCHGCGAVLDDRANDITYDDELDVYEHDACRAERLGGQLIADVEDWLENVTAHG